LSPAGGFRGRAIDCC